MTSLRLSITILPFAIGALACAAFNAKAHEIDAHGKIIVACPEEGAPLRRAAISRAIENSRYWAGQATREHMFKLAKQACNSNLTAVRFIPQPDEPSRLPDNARPVALTQ